MVFVGVIVFVGVGVGVTLSVQIIKLRLVIEPAPIGPIAKSLIYNFQTPLV